MDSNFYYNSSKSSFRNQDTTFMSEYYEEEDDAESVNILFSDETDETTQDNNKQFLESTKNDDDQTLSANDTIHSESEVVDLAEDTEGNQNVEATNEPIPTQRHSLLMKTKRACSVSKKILRTPKCARYFK